jgi:hypothetical protein
MMAESSFVLLCKPLDFARHNIHLQDIVKYASLFNYYTEETSRN